MSFALPVIQATAAQRRATMREISIHDACRKGDIDAVRAMIAADPATVDADDEHGWRPLFHAALWRHKES